jgi:hypothetical protein
MHIRNKPNKEIVIIVESLKEKNPKSFNTQSSFKQ